MRTIETEARVTRQGQLTARVPNDVSPGLHKIILILTDLSGGPFADGSAAFPVDHVAKWPRKLSLRREDLYGHEGR